MLCIQTDQDVGFKSKSIMEFAQNLYVRGRWKSKSEHLWLINHYVESNSIFIIVLNNNRSRY